jgi:hypothetical protein
MLQGTEMKLFFTESVDLVEDYSKGYKKAIEDFFSII